MKIRQINGFTRALHPYQVTSYVYFLGLFLVYFFTIFPLSTLVAKIIGAILVIINGVVVVVSGYIVTKTDPTDSYVQAAKQAIGKKETYTPPENEYYCTYDKSHVHESSKHCRRCDRCTEGFDHHCKWVNNDVGRKNYKSFFILITSTMTFLLIFLLFGALVTADFARDQLLVEKEIYLYEAERGSVLIGLVIMWVFMGISIVFVCLVANLVFFHIFLIKKGLTTFQYITLIEERKEYKREMEYARKILGGKENKTRLDFVLCLDRKKNKKQLKKSASATNKSPDRQVETKADSDRKEADLEANKKLSSTENDDLVESLALKGTAKSMNDCGSKGSLDELKPGDNDESRKVEVLEKGKLEKPKDITITVREQEAEAGNSECMEAFIHKQYTLKVQGPSLPTLDTLERESDIEGFAKAEERRKKNLQLEIKKQVNEKYMRDLVRTRKRNDSRALALEIIDNKEIDSQRKQQDSSHNAVGHKSFMYFPDKENSAGYKAASHNVSRNLTSPHMIHNKMSSSPMVNETNSANLESKEMTIMRLDEMKIEEDEMSSSQGSQLTGEAIQSKKGNSECSFKELEVETLG